MRQFRNRLLSAGPLAFRHVDGEKASPVSFHGTMEESAC